MKKALSLLAFAGILAMPSFVMALEDPVVSSYVSKINANTYTFNITTVPGATVTVVGGPADIAPVTDGAEGDVLDGQVKVMVGLKQEAINTFSIIASKGTDTSNSITISIHETASVSTGTQKGDTVSPEAPQLDPIQSPYSGTSIEISGSAEADANIYAKDPFGKSVGSTKANSNGIFHVTVRLTPGKTNRINISAEDAAGNEGLATQAVIQVLPGGSEESASEVPSTIPFVDAKGHWAESYIDQLYKKEIINGKSVTIFDPDGLITRAELTKVAMKAFIEGSLPVVTKNPFTDVAASAWFAPFVEQARAHGILAGYSDGSFKPNDLITRAEALKILILASGIDYAGTASYFSDVPQEAWFGPYVSFAKNNGIVGGYEDGTFKPGNPVTRAEVTKMVSKILELKAR